MTLFRAFDIPIKLHWSYCFLVAIILLPFSTLSQFIFGLYIIFMISGIIISHELGHSLAAQKIGHNVSQIILFALGGQANIHSAKKLTPEEEIFVTISGPLVNLVLGVLGVSAHILLFNFGIISPDNLYFIAFWFVNFAMGIFNLVPAFPMDGGRLFRAVLSKFFGHVKGTMVATGVSFGFAILMCIGAFLLKDPILLGVAIFITYTSNQERKNVKLTSSK